MTAGHAFAIAVFTKNRTNPACAAARLGADRAAQPLGAQTLHFVPVKGDDPDDMAALATECAVRRPTTEGGQDVDLTS